MNQCDRNQPNLTLESDRRRDKFINFLGSQYQ